YAAIGYKQFKKLDKFSVHRNSQNLKYGGNQKAGYKYAIARGTDIVALLHADGQYAPEILNTLLEPLESGEADMVLGSRMARGADPRAGGMPFYKFIGNKILTRIENLLTGMRLSDFHSGYRLYRCDGLEKIPFLLNSDDWHFDTEMLIQFHEAGLRIAERPIPTYYGDEIRYVNGLAYGYNCMRTALKYRLHKAGVLYDRKFDISSDKYEYKRVDPHSSHAQICEWITKECPRTVLEVGTATGYLSQEMTNLGCSVTGIEQDPDMAAIASQYCVKMITGDVEAVNVSTLGTYDAIIFGDVLEHLKDPQAVLTQFAKLLAPDGKILISLPNVANLWVRLNLLFGRFEYSRVGILDQTHLRFFTLKTARELVRSCGLDVVDTSATPIPIRSIVPEGRNRTVSFLHLVAWTLTKIRKTLFGYQFVFICRPKT
ncbi:MAG TPA: bifunctional glycosyltransferase/class I SAM-dependent methyltransferase, partial [Blastocatellia bacterium]